MAPACICRRASAELLCILACGRQRMSCLRANSAMRVRFRCMASRSTTSAGVSIASTDWPTRSFREPLDGGFIGGRVLEVVRVGPADEGEALGRPEQAVDGTVGQF